MKIHYFNGINSKNQLNQNSKSNNNLSDEAANTLSKGLNNCFNLRFPTLNLKYNLNYLLIKSFQINSMKSSKQ